MSNQDDVFQINQDYPTPGFLLVPPPNPNLYTVYIFNYSDWVVGKQNPLYAIAQSAVNPNGTWLGVLDPISQTYSPITLAETAVNDSPAGPYTVVAISNVNTVVLALQVIAPATTPTSLIAGPGILITGDWPDQTITATGGGGGSVFSPTIQTSAYAAEAQDLVLCNTSGGGFTVTLPLSASNKGATIIIKKISSDTNLLTVATSGSDVIDGHANELIAFSKTSMSIIADGISIWEIT